LAPFLGERKGVFILERFYIVNIIVEDRQNAYRQVNELLHDFADVIKLRVGYPVPDENMAIILLIVKTTNDVIGSMSGKLGQVKGVKVKTMPLK
jgi:putative iron-only hydrogenase system regulator